MKPGLSYEPPDVDSFPIFSARLDHPMAEFVRPEVVTSYRRPDVQRDENITDHLGITGEYRFREDDHEVVTYSNKETTVGLFWTF